MLMNKKDYFYLFCLQHYFKLIYVQYILCCLITLGQSNIIFRVWKGGNPGHFLRDTNYKILVVHDVNTNERSEILIVLLKNIQ